MKLTKVIALFSALMVLFAFVGCPGTENTPVNNTPNKPDDKQYFEAFDDPYSPVTVEDPTVAPGTNTRLSIYAAKGDPVLPSGTGKDMPTWDVAANGKQGLPPFITKFNVTEAGVYQNTNLKTTSKTNVTPELKAALKEAQETEGFFARKPRNVIVIISDGMGEPQVKMSREYKGELICDSIMFHRGVDHRSFIKGDTEAALKDKKKLTTTDSCAGGTAILSGYKTRYGYIGLDRDGKQIPTLAELAKKKGMKVGCVTNDCTTDATPATTLCHSSVRDSGDCLDVQQALFGADVVIGGYTEIQPYVNPNFLTKVESSTGKAWDMSKEGVKTATVKDWWSQYKSGKYGNMFAKYVFGNAKYFADKDADWFTEYLTGQNYGYATKMDAMLKFFDDPTKKAIMDVNQAAPQSLSENFEMGFLLNKKNYPSFPEMVAYTVAKLYDMDKNDPKSNGFFCMIENTTTDGWGHYDAITRKTKPSPAADGNGGISNENIKPAFIANEVQNTDEGVAIAIKFVLEHPDTLLVVTADHDTGHLKFDKGWENDYEKVWSDTSSHSSAMVPLWAVGAGADLFAKDLKGNVIDKISINEIMTTDIIDNPDKTDYINYYTGAKIGQLMGDPNFGCRQNGDPRYGGYTSF